ncbi:MAG: UDP-N-acetylmuramoyl-tripeptide--D-alanyl-D-alanine ligase [Candidatus Omnitrophota bacterium]|nr:UDP-N-acetylmuramoyl-tripeptide--D-alanyl-D-alanine ligase [Candidatus Omnitrophota bacterium]
MFSFHEAASWLGARLDLEDSTKRPAGVSIDTRTLQPGDLFIALQGPARDGHDYLDDAFQKGASGAVVSDKWDARNANYKNLLCVTDPEKGLGLLASQYFSRHKVPLVGVTGSIGKTTTKQFLAYLLGLKFKPLASAGNFNNQLGVPLTLLSLRAEHDICIAEMGASRPGDIAYLASLAQPDAAVITRVSPAHLEGFGTLDAVYKGKAEIAANLAENSFLVIPDDDPILSAEVSHTRSKVIKVGTTTAANYRYTDVHVSGHTVEFRFCDRYRFKFSSMAAFYVRNAAMALAVFESLGGRLEDVPEYWKGLELMSGRFEQKWIGDGLCVIDDCYNASPASFQDALQTFDALDAKGRKILVFSDMLEMGKDEEAYHGQLGEAISRCKLDCVVAYGSRAAHSLKTLKEMRPEATVYKLSDPEETTQFLKGYLQPGDLLLLKASRGMRMDKVLRSLEAV